MSRITTALALLATTAMANAGAVDLTAANFDEMTAGKGTFIMFMAPWCGHCQALKPAWGELGDAFAGSTAAIIGIVDCDVEESLCAKNNVEGYPTVMANGEEYDGGREYAELKAFADENLYLQHEEDEHEHEEDEDEHEEDEDEHEEKEDQAPDMGQEEVDPTLEEHGDSDEPFDPNQDSWWFTAHDKEMMAANDQPGPISQMMDDFHVYTDAIRAAYEDNAEKEGDLLAKLKAEFPDIEWDKPAAPPDESMPEGDQQHEEHEELLSERIHGHLDDAFYHAKDKAAAEKLMSFLETLAPGAAVDARAETYRIANLSEEDYMLEFADMGLEEDHEEL